MKEPLDAYIKQFSKVKILRSDKRQGLIKARLRGAAIAKGPVITFLDSHIECTAGWLEPLLDRIAEHSRTVVCPVIVEINDNTFKISEYESPRHLHIGAFDWNLNFNWYEIPQREQKRRINPASDPLQTPAMAGGLFSIDKQFFEQLGTYDPSFEFWGAENLELSFKTWMCGGILEILPCSNVGHIYRDSPLKVCKT